MSEYGQFLRGLMDNPRGVSAPTPSSPALAAAIAAKVDPAIPGLVVELGPGTGVVTQALLARGIAPERLLLFETGEYFAGLLLQRFAGVKVLQADALDFARHIPAGTAVAAVVSGVPLLNFPPATRRALIVQSLALQGPRGRFIQLSYGWQPGVPPDNGLLLDKTLVWRNMPPAHVWTYSRA
jgi:phosphatidylethanolamine/phosphatidyl-N-methylethanolamine N-methyltransferase